MKPMAASDFEKAEIIFKVLLKEPQEFELHCKPSAERKPNFMCTLNMATIPISSARADDNGAYGKRGNTRKTFYVSDDVCQQAHKTQDNRYYINERDTSAATARPVYIRKFVNIDYVYQLTRQYRYSKSNKYYNMIAIVNSVNSTRPHPYYMYLSRWYGEVDENQDFAVERYGNATTSHAAPYFKKDAPVFKEVRKRLESGASPDEVYVQMSKQNDNVKSVSQMLSNPKLVHNEKRKVTASTSSKNILKNDAEELISLIQGETFVQTVRFDSDSYSSVNYLPHMLNDLNRFCVNGNSAFVVDTTFQVADKLWLTDSSYENESLVDDEGKHPHFPGPSQWQFRRDQLSFRRLIGELIIADPNLQNIKKIGHDLDAATANGLQDLLPNSNHIWCTQHLQSADREKLNKMGANKRTKDRIMTDIYGFQTGSVMSEGLADAVDEEDLMAKLETLKDVWEDLIPGFHEWFLCRRVDKFKNCLTISARESLGISGRFYSNSLELKHRLLKKKLNDLSSSRDVTSASINLTKWLQENFLEEAKKAIIGQGKYRLSRNYQQFYVNPVEWVRWSSKRRTQHFEAFLGYCPRSFEKLVKPADACAKRKPGEKRRAGLPEPDLFSPLLSSTPASSAVAVTPLKVKKTSDNLWHVQQKSLNIDIFNPNRIASKMYLLVHKSDKSSLPASVKRCEQCKIAFYDADIIAVKTTAIREYTDKNGKRQRNSGNVYIHYLAACLKGHDQKFQFKAITVPKNTKKHLTDDQIARLAESGCIIE